MALLPALRSTSANAPGAPVFPSGSVVVCLKHGQPGPESSGWSLLTTMGAAPWTSSGMSARAAAVAVTVAWSMLKMFAKKLGTSFRTLTTTVSCGWKSLRSLMS